MQLWACATSQKGMSNKNLKYYYYYYYYHHHYGKSSLLVHIVMLQSFTSIV